MSQEENEQLEQLSEEEALKIMEDLFVREVLLFPNDILRTECEPVAEEEFGGERLAQVIKSLQCTMAYYKGAGIAAPQISVDRRVIMIGDETYQNPLNARVYINPQITSTSEETTTCREGCLSFPNIYANVVRPKDIIVKFYDFEGNEHIESYTGLDAIVLQHEIDHLDGVLFIDRLSPFARARLIDKYKKRTKMNAQVQEMVDNMKRIQDKLS